VALFAAALTGCDNGGSYEAKLEDARIAIDDGNYAQAKSILQTLPRTPEVLQYLSNAIAGEDLNLDTFNIITTLSELDDSGNTGSIDMIGKIIGDDNDQLTPEEIAAKLASATEAIDLFKEIAMDEGTGMDGLSDDQKIQVGLLAIARTVLTLADMISREMSDQTVVMTEEWIRDNRDSFATVHPTDDELASISEDLTYTEYAIGALSSSNDLSDDFTEFRDELDANQDGLITADELNAYIDGM
jgi:hypothetical protein